MSTAVSGTITAVHRLPNSGDGNPRWRLDVQFGDAERGQFYTEKNSQVGHLISPRSVGRAVTLYCNAKAAVIGLVNQP